MDQRDNRNERITNMVQDSVRVFDYFPNVLTLIFRKYLSRQRKQSDLSGSSRDSVDHCNGIAV
jgi:hypothetical protein